MDPVLTTRGDGTELTVVHGSEAILREIARLSDEATETMDSLLPHVPTKEALDVALAKDTEPLRRGVRLRSIFPAAARDLDYVRDYAAAFQGRGASVRTSAVTPARAIVFDQKVAFVITGARTPRARGVTARDSAFADAISGLFLVLWDGAVDLPGETETSSISPVERSILRSMQLGVKDEAIARSMDVSPRTVRRAIDAMAARVGAESRLALGVEAARRGWLDG